MASLSGSAPVSCKYQKMLGIWTRQTPTRKRPPRGAQPPRAPPWQLSCAKLDSRVSNGKREIQYHRFERTGTAPPDDDDGPLSFPTVRCGVRSCDTLALALAPPEQHSLLTVWRPCKRPCCSADWAYLCAALAFNNSRNRAGWGSTCIHAGRQLQHLNKILHIDRPTDTTGPGCIFSHIGVVLLLLWMDPFRSRLIFLFFSVEHTHTRSQEYGR